MKLLVPLAAAERDVEDAAAYYVREAGEDVAMRFAAALRRAYHGIADRPGTGSLRFGEVLEIPNLRTRKLGRFPYLVCYVELDDRIEVWRVLHARRDIPETLRGG